MRVGLADKKVESAMREAEVKVTRMQQKMDDAALMSREKNGSVVAKFMSYIAVVFILKQSPR